MVAREVFGRRYLFHVVKRLLYLRAYLQHRVAYQLRRYGIGYHRLLTSNCSRRALHTFTPTSASTTVTGLSSSSGRPAKKIPIGIPAPGDTLTFQVNASYPAVNPVERDVVRTSGQDRPPRRCELHGKPAKLLPGSDVAQRISHSLYERDSTGQKPPHRLE